MTDQILTKAYGKCLNSERSTDIRKLMIFTRIVQRFRVKWTHRHFLGAFGSLLAFLFLPLGSGLAPELAFCNSLSYLALSCAAISRNLAFWFSLIDCNEKVEGHRTCTSVLFTRTIPSNFYSSKITFFIMKDQKCSNCLIRYQFITVHQCVTNVEFDQIHHFDLRSRFTHKSILTQKPIFM